MGKPDTATADLSNNVKTAAAMGAVNAVTPATGMFIPRPTERNQGRFNVSITSAAFVGTLAIQRSFDGGTTWAPVLRSDTGASLGALVNTAQTDLQLQLQQHEKGVGYRAIVTAYTSGTVTVRFSQ